MKRNFCLALLTLLFIWGSGQGLEKDMNLSKEIIPIVKSEEEWKKTLTPDQYEVCRLKGTERAFTGKYWDNHEPGAYNCVACGLELFKSDTKFESGTGWPSFWDPASKAHVKLETDHSHGTTRTEVTCARCGAHLGHVFEDGPAPTHQRYCINSLSLQFKKQNP